MQHQWDPKVGRVPHLKWAMVGGAMEIVFVALMNIGETFILGTQMLRFVHVQDVHNHPIEDLCLEVGFMVEINGFSKIGVQ
jgi:hypothetical protein